MLTLLKILTEAALFEGKDVRTSELHGLSQREGSVKVHLRIGRDIYSPLVVQGQADLIIALEIQEALRVCHFASKEKETVFLVNDFFVPVFGRRLPQKISPKKKNAFLKDLRKFSREVILVPAIDICQKELRNPVTAGVFLLSFALHRDLIPLKKKSVLKAMKKVIPRKYLDLNLKTFDLASLYQY